MNAQAVAWCQELVRTPSVNPHGDPGCDNPGEAALAGKVASLLASLGAHTQLREVKPGRPNVVAKFCSHRHDKPRLILAPHLDTVSVAGMAIPPFSGELRDGRIWGRGATDTKGPMAAMLTALAEEGEAIRDLPYEVWFVGLMGEEAGQEGARAFVSEAVAQGELDPDRTVALIGEPTDLRVVHATKGAAWLTLSAEGKAAHASTPERGENAIYRIADALRVLREEVLPSFDAITAPVLGKPTGSAGVIRGGSKTNIVPDRCTLEVDFRTVPGQDIAPSIAALERAAPGLSAKVWQSPPMWTAPDHPFVAALAAAGDGLAGAPWFCDAAIFAAAGIPAVAAGPGSIAQAHTTDEWIRVEDLARGVAFYRAALRCA